MSMEQVLTFVVEMIFGYFLVTTVLAIIAVIQHRRAIKQIRTTVKERLNELKVELRIETEGDMAYFWEKANNRFIAQARNWDELTEHLKARKMAETIFIVDGEEMAKVDWLQGHVRTTTVEVKG